MKGSGREILIHLEEQLGAGEQLVEHLQWNVVVGLLWKSEKTAVIPTRVYGSREPASALHLSGLIFLGSTTVLPFLLLSWQSKKSEHALTPLDALYHPPSILQPHPGGLLLSVAALSKVRTGDLSPSPLSTVSHSQSQQCLGGDDRAARSFFWTHTHTHTSRDLKVGVPQSEATETFLCLVFFRPGVLHTDINVTRQQHTHRL